MEYFYCEKGVIHCTNVKPENVQGMLVEIDSTFYDTVTTDFMDQTEMRSYKAIVLTGVECKSIKFTGT